MPNAAPAAEIRLDLVHHRALTMPRLAAEVSKRWHRRKKLHYSVPYRWLHDPRCPLPHARLPGVGIVTTMEAFMEWVQVRARRGAPSQPAPAADDAADLETLERAGILPSKAARK